MSLEVTINPKLLLDNNIKTTDLLFGGYKLYNSSCNIDNNIIKEAGISKFPKGTIGVYWGKEFTTFYLENKTLEFYLKDKIISVKRHGGVFVLYNGFSFSIYNKRIESIRLPKQIIAYYQQIKYEEIETLFGKADLIIQDCNNEYATNYESIFVYIDKLMQIYYCEFSYKIKEITISDSWAIIEKYWKE